jgi:hypothetical protein
VDDVASARHGLFQTVSSLRTSKVRLHGVLTPHIVPSNQARDQPAQNQVGHNRQDERYDDCFSWVYKAQLYDLIHNVEY